MVRVLIVGGGVGGLTLARCLKTFGIDSVVFEQRKEILPRVRRGLGLWDNAQNALRQIGLGKWLEENARFIPAAAYRNQRGEWLSKCSNVEKNKRRVACVDQNDLLSELYEGCEGQGRLELEVGKRVKNLIMAPDAIPRLQFNNGDYVNGDIVVGADGRHSYIRSLLDMRSQSHAKPMDMVCVSSIVNMPLQDPAFETLSGSGGNNRRFAVVPLVGDRLFWFATLHHSKNPFTLKYRELANGHKGSLAILRHLKELYAQFHHPIPQIIDQTSNDLLNDGGGLLVEDVVTMEPPLANLSSQKCVLVGDACHAMPPNLAQGAALAIEDAYELSVAIRNNLNTNLGIENVFKEYEDKRRARVAQCRSVTRFTQMLADHPNLANLMKYVPGSINGYVFDKFLDYSLGGEYSIPHVDSAS